MEIIESEEKPIELAGIVLESVDASKYRIALENGNQAIADVSGKLRLSFTEILPGDKVCVEFSPYDLNKGRIVGRLNKE